MRSHPTIERFLPDLLSKLLYKLTLPGFGSVSLSNHVLVAKELYLEIICSSREKLVAYVKSLATSDAAEVALAG